MIALVLLGDRCLHRIQVHQQRALVDIHEHRSSAGHDYRLGGRREGVHRGDHFVARSDPACTQRKVKRVRSRPYADRVGGSDERRELIFKPLDVRTESE